MKPTERRKAAQIARKIYCDNVHVAVEKDGVILGMCSGATMDAYLLSIEDVRELRKVLDKALAEF